MQILPAIRCHEFPVRLKAFVDFVSSQIVFMVDLEQYQSFLFIGIKFELGRLDFNSCQHPFPVNLMFGTIALKIVYIKMIIIIFAKLELMVRNFIMSMP